MVYFSLLLHESLSTNMQETFVSYNNTTFIIKYEYKVEDGVINMKIKHSVNGTKFHYKQLEFPTYLKNRIQSMPQYISPGWEYNIKISESKNHCDEVRDIIQTFKNTIIHNHKETINENDKLRTRSCEDTWCGFGLGAGLMFLIMLFIILYIKKSY